jgi:hypothetical protein
MSQSRSRSSSGTSNKSTRSFKPENGLAELLGNQEESKFIKITPKTTSTSPRSARSVLARPASTRVVYETAVKKGEGVEDKLLEQINNKIQENKINIDEKQDDKHVLPFKNALITSERDTFFILILARTVRFLRKDKTVDRNNSVEHILEKLVKHIRWEKWLNVSPREVSKLINRMTPYETYVNTYLSERWNEEIERHRRRRISILNADQREGEIRSRYAGEYELRFKIRKLDSLLHKKSKESVLQYYTQGKRVGGSTRKHRNSKRNKTSKKH